MVTGPDIDALSLQFTRTELSIFAFLARSVGYWRTTREVSEETIGWPSTSLKTHIVHLRKKLQGTAWAIDSRPGRGYQLVKRGT